MIRILIIIALALCSTILAQAQESAPERDRVAIPPVSRDAVLPAEPTNAQPMDTFSLGGEEGPEPIHMTPVPDADGISRIAVMRGLDKITARVRDLEAPVGVPVMFESFEIIVQTCRRRPPEETPETTAFVQITEHRLDGTFVPVFSGWMFASTPALNPVEHPIYDVWLIDCITL